MRKLLQCLTIIFRLFGVWILTLTGWYLLGHQTMSGFTIVLAWVVAVIVEVLMEVSYEQ